MNRRPFALFSLPLAIVAVACATRTGEAPGYTSTRPASPDAAPEVQDGTVHDAGPSDAAVPDAAPAEAADAGPVGPRLLELGYRINKTHKEPHLSWRQVQTLNWQAVAEGLAPLPPASALSPSECPTGMISIRGGLLLDKKGKDDTDLVEAAQDTACEQWRVPKRVCDRFSEEKWKALAAAFPRKDMHFCVDRYEYPNRQGEFPLVVTTFSESEKYCAKEGKRLCTENEWTLACEGEEGRPYPYGYARDATACPIDRPRIEPPEDTFIPRTNGHTARGIDTMWQGERSGAFARCVSPFGVADMTGNVDEWTRSVRTWGYKMILKGGHWSYVRARCRPQTRGHGPKYVNVETGFRCCQDAPPKP
ncbi:MAG: SUMF1/EgtB/PvdO family nonheme iron enzyme [Polyangiaceae bacterium]|nr:SUMF1/EgtB/PvdO family nonheme iron enzyme [Polyangiaceae bacterium]